MISQAVYLHYLSSLLDGNKTDCIKIVKKELEKGTDVKNIYIDLIQKSMYRIGYLWEHNRAKISTEHIASKITDSILTLIADYFADKEKVNRTFIITCVDKEFHELGAKMIADYLEIKGWNSIFLGSNTPKEEIISLIENKKPDLFGLSNNLYINVARLIRLMNDIRQNFPDQKVIVGGQAIGEEYHNYFDKYPNITYINSLDALDYYITSHFNEEKVNA